MLALMKYLAQLKEHTNPIDAFKSYHSNIKLIENDNSGPIAKF